MATSPAEARGAIADVRLEEVVSRLDLQAARWLQILGVPGIAVALTDRERLLACRTYGAADLATGRPLHPDDLFEIGSIGKPFTCVALLQLAEAGQLDLAAPVAGYLPWCPFPASHGPIRIHHLMSHTGGIPGTYSHTPPSRYEVLRLAAGAPAGRPGERFHYSNLGYKILGFLLEERTSLAYGEILRRRILEPLGMEASEPVITRGLRGRLSPGYQRLDDDRPACAEDPLVPAPLCEYRTGDGSLASTPADLARFLRLLLNRGAAPGGTLLTRASCALMMRAATENAWYPGLCYGYGLVLSELAGHPCFGHAGETPGYSSVALGDAAAGVGVVAYANGPGDVYGLASEALTLLRAAGAGEPLPAAAPHTPGAVPNGADYPGTYTSHLGRIEVVARDGGLALEHADGAARLEPRGGDRFFVRHPVLSRFLLCFGRSNGEVVEAAHGPSWYAGVGYRGPASFPRMAEWEGYAGQYRSHNPWLPSFRVLHRKGELLLVLPSGAESRLLPWRSCHFFVGEPGGPEWLGFDAPARGKAQRARYSGCDYYRTLDS